MMSSIRKPLLLLALAATVFAACVPDITGVSTFCDHMIVNYFDDEGEGGTYRLQARLASNNAPVSPFVTGPIEPSGRVEIEYDDDLEPGTLVYLYAEYTDAEGDFTSGSRDPVPCVLSPDTPEGEPEITWFEPGDDRINRQAYASVAIYCNAANGQLEIYAIDAEGNGSLALAVPYADLPATPDAATGNVGIAQAGNIALYRLTTGEFQVNAGPDSEGKTYVVIWDACPYTQIAAYILQNGVMTPTELTVR